MVVVNTVFSSEVALVAAPSMAETQIHFSLTSVRSWNFYLAVVFTRTGDRRLDATALRRRCHGGQKPPPPNFSFNLWDSAYDILLVRQEAPKMLQIDGTGDSAHKLRCSI